MGEARDVMDRVTTAIFSKDFSTAAKIYAPDAVAETPDEGEIRGAEAIAEWTKEFMVALPDAGYESGHEYEVGNVAIDEGWAVGTNTGPLKAPDGSTIPATGRSVRLRVCDVATVEDGHITSHRFYYDQMEFLGQLGLG